MSVHGLWIHFHEIALRPIDQLPNMSKYCAKCIAIVAHTVQAPFMRDEVRLW